MKIKRKEKVSIMIGKQKVASILLTSLLVLSFSMIFTNEALAYDYPPLPLLAVKAPMVGRVDVWLKGEGETDLDSFWDIAGLDIQMHYDPDALQVTNIIVDPDMWFESFWPGGISILLLENSPGFARVAILGIAGNGGTHTAPFGQGRIFTLETIGLARLADISLRSPDPRPDIAPWGTAGFPVDVAGFPHADRGMAPWFGLKKAPPIPHVVTVQTIEALFSGSTYHPKPSEVIYLDASQSYSEVGIASYEWDFDSDGDVDATGVTASTSYTQFGFYQITLKITDNGGMTNTAAAITMVNVLQNAEAEHRIFKVLSDEDGFNTLTATARNYGTVSALVKARFTTIDKETGAELGTLESAPAELMTGRVDLSADWNPNAYGWTPGTVVRYDVRVELSFFDGHAWVTGETFKLGFRATD